MNQVSVPPPNIWRYDECAAVNTDTANMKEYKPVGQFYTDAHMLCKLFNIKAHPCFKEPLPFGVTAQDHAVGAFDDQKRAKEPTTISISKYRLDPNSLKVLFKVLEGCTHIQTLKLQNNGLTVSTFQKLSAYLASDLCPIVNLFLDWNPIYEDDFRAGDNFAAAGSNKLWVQEDEEKPNLWSKLIEANKKLQVLFLRASGLTDTDLSYISTIMKVNSSIKVLDVSSNVGLSASSVDGLTEVL